MEQEHVEQRFFKAVAWLAKRRWELERKARMPNSWRSERECIEAWNYYLEKKRRFHETIEKEFNESL